MPQAFAAKGELLLTCATKSAAPGLAATQWTADELKTPEAKTITVDGTPVTLLPFSLFGTDYVQITTGGQDDEVVVKWSKSETRTMDNGVRVKCYFQHDDD